MKKIYRYTFLILMTGFLFAACSSGNKMGSKKGCGCGAHKGYVGY